MSLELREFNTIVLDMLIDSLTIIRSFTYISSSGTTTVNSIQLAELDTKINTLKRIREEFRTNYEKVLKDLPTILEEISK